MVRLLLFIGIVFAVTRRKYGGVETVAFLCYTEYIISASGGKGVLQWSAFLGQLIISNIRLVSRILYIS